MNTSRNILSVWKGRLLRLWAAVLLPIAAVCAYQAIQYHQTAVGSRELAAKWFEVQRRHDAEGTSPILFDPRVGQQEMSSNADEAESKRDLYISSSVALALAPLIFGLLLVLLRWVWRGGEVKLCGSCERRE